MAVALVVGVVLRARSALFARRMAADGAPMRASPGLLALAELGSALLLSVGAVVSLSPIALYWWIHGDYARYLSIIRGPAPFNQFGGGPFQLWMSVGLLVLGVAALGLGVALRAWLRNRLRHEVRER
jgi:hypothetical protein